MRCTSTCFRDPRSSHSSAVGHEPLDDLGTCAPGAGGVVVEGPWRGVPCQGDAAPLRGRRRFSVPVHRDPKAPAGSVLGVEDDTAAAVDLRARILDAVDRGNPCGKRDDAIILLVTRLGLRSIDVKRLEFADFDWPGCRLSVAQAKTGSQVWLPLLKDVGWAVTTTPATAVRPAAAPRCSCGTPPRSSRSPTRTTCTRSWSSTSGRRTSRRARTGH
jgi:hypothetical protein